MVRRSILVASTSLAVLGGVVPFVGCGTQPVGEEACRQIEEARCRRAPACGVDLSEPVHTGDDVDACIRYYDVACVHGLSTSVEPSTTSVKACLDAIAAADCSVTPNAVTTPQSAADCAFLVPVSNDAGLPDGATDGATDAAALTPPTIPDAG